MEECLGGVGMELPVTEGGKLSGMDVVVEESGPVKYCGDDDLEELCCVAYYNYIATLLFR